MADVNERQNTQACVCKCSQHANLPIACNCRFSGSPTSCFTILLVMTYPCCICFMIKCLLRPCCYHLWTHVPSEQPTANLAAVVATIILHTHFWACHPLSYQEFQTPQLIAAQNGHFSSSFLNSAYRVFARHSLNMQVKLGI